MKVHPAPGRRNTTLRHELITHATRQKKLRRLPHIFAKVLELPFRANTDVSVEETDEFLRFTVFDTDVAVDVIADTVEIHPGVTKIVVRSGGVAIDRGLINEFAFELDLWRFRLPASTRPELAVASYVDGDLVVTVPKGEGEEEEEEGEVWGEGGNFVLV